MAYSNFYVNYEKSDKKESDYIKEDKEEKKKPKRDNRWQTLLLIIAGMETPKTDVTVNTTTEYPSIPIPKKEEPQIILEELQEIKSVEEKPAGLTMVNKDMAVDQQYFNNWVKTMTEVYKKAGLSDNAIRNLITKNSLESSWGTSELATKHFNFGGLTAGSKWKGRIVNLGDRNKEGKTIINTFRSYDNLNDFINDEQVFLKMYDFDQNDNIHTFASKLKGANMSGLIYAEDPQYYVKLLTRYNQIYGTGNSRNRR